MTGERQPSAELDEGYVAFVNDYLEDIQLSFANENLPETVKALHELERERAKELFG